MRHIKRAQHLKLMLRRMAIGLSFTRFMTFGCNSRIPERNIALGYLFPFGMDMKSLVDSVVKFTFLFEAAGFAALWITFGCLGVERPAWNTLFISISSFCTAGFSTFSDSLCAFSGNYAVNIIVPVLSYGGAMGFIVMTDLQRKILNRKHSITFTTRVIVTITFWMTVAGTAVLLIFPRQGEPAAFSTRFPPSRRFFSRPHRHSALCE